MCHIFDKWGLEKWQTVEMTDGQTRKFMLSIESYRQDRVKDLCSSRGPPPFSVHKLTFSGRNQHTPNVSHYQLEKRNCSESSHGRLETVLANCPAFLWLEPISPPYHIICQGGLQNGCVMAILYYLFCFFQWIFHLQCDVSFFFFGKSKCLWASMMCLFFY